MSRAPLRGGGGGMKPATMPVHRSRPARPACRSRHSATRACRHRRRTETTRLVDIRASAQIRTRAAVQGYGRERAESFIVQIFGLVIAALIIRCAFRVLRILLIIKWCGIIRRIDAEGRFKDNRR